MAGPVPPTAAQPVRGDDGQIGCIVPSAFARLYVVQDAVGAVDHEIVLVVARSARETRSGIESHSVLLLLEALQVRKRGNRRTNRRQSRGVRGRVNTTWICILLLRRNKCRRCCCCACNPAGGRVADAGCNAAGSRPTAASKATARNRIRRPLIRQRRSSRAGGDTTRSRRRVSAGINRRVGAGISRRSGPPDHIRKCPQRPQRPIH